MTCINDDVFNSTDSSGYNSNNIIAAVTDCVTSGKLFNSSACFLICEMGIIIIPRVVVRIK